MQNDITVTSSRISGTSYYTTGYTEFSGDAELQEGNYVAVKFEIPESATATIQLIGGAVVRDPVELDSDMNAVLRITDPVNQKLKVVVSADGAEDYTKIYHFNGLKCLTTPAPDPEN